jgi:vancomycin permeability regulator SanA
VSSLFKKIFFVLVGLAAVGSMVFFLTFFLIDRMYSRDVYRDADQIPAAHVALVLGAGLNNDGSSSPILTDRVQAAVTLYKKHKVEKLLVSGDNRAQNYNEPEVMRRLAIDLGVDPQDVQPDYAGRRTYDSCWRAKNIFGQDRMIVVTQSFHLTRALFLCDQLGIESSGFVADQPNYTFSQWSYWQLRDMLSIFLSLWDLYFKHPYVVKGDRIAL